MDIYSKQVVVDLETLSTHANACIVSIGAVMIEDLEILKGAPLTSDVVDEFIMDKDIVNRDIDIQHSITVHDKVLLIDADVGLRNLDLLLGMENRIIYTGTDVIGEKCSIETFIKPVRGSSLIKTLSIKLPCACWNVGLSETQVFDPSSYTEGSYMSWLSS